MKLPEIIAQDCLLVSQAVGDLSGQVHPKEQAMARRFGSASRLAEFTAARRAAQTAMCEAGYPPLPLGKGPSGQPLWPLGQTASLAHTDQWAACLIAKRHRPLIGLGLDFESNRRIINQRTAEGVLSKQEQSLILGPGDLLATFCIKEALFKCLHPLGQVWFGFKDARLVALEPERFAIELLVQVWPGKTLPTIATGRLIRTEQHLWALIGLKENLNWAWE